tara:strand:- start:2121 stop:3245 length:1125 start_codon:yes stop_codon:yes gene_type:complete
MGVKVTNNAFGTLSAGINSSVTTIALDAGQGAKFPSLTGSDFFFATLIDTSNNLEVVKVTARSSDSMTVTRGQDNTSARSFSSGDRFEIRPVAALFEAIVDGAGDVTLTGTQTLTNKTITSPKIGTSILDTNGNELFKLTATGSAVNELTYANAATGNKPTLTASGGDTNIGVSIQPKGSGQVTIDNLTFPAADGSANQILKTDGSGSLSFIDQPGGGITWATAVDVSTSASSADFTGIPSTAEYCVLVFSDLGVSSTWNYVRFGHSGGFVTSGYGSSVMYPQNNVAYTNRGDATAQGAGASIIYGSVTQSGFFQCWKVKNNIWTWHSQANDNTTTFSALQTGTIDVGAVLTQLRVLNASGNNFGGGTVRLGYM